MYLLVMLALSLMIVCVLAIACFALWHHWTHLAMLSFGCSFIFFVVWLLTSADIDGVDSGIPSTVTLPHWSFTLILASGVGLMISAGVQMFVSTDRDDGNQILDLVEGYTGAKGDGSVISADFRGARANPQQPSHAATGTDDKLR